MNVWYIFCSRKYSLFKERIEFMKEKYLIVMSEVTKENFNETHCIKFYDSFCDDEELFYFLQDDIKNIFIKEFKKGDVVEVLLFEVDDKHVRMYEGFDELANSKSLFDYFEWSTKLGSDSQDLALFYTLLERLRVRKKKKHYMVVLVKDKLEQNHKISRDIIAKPKFDDENLLFKFLSENVSVLVTGSRINNLILDRKELISVYLYEWSEETYGSCYEYSDFIRHGIKKTPSDFFRTKTDKDKDSTLLFFIN